MNKELEFAHKGGREVYVYLKWATGLSVLLVKEDIIFSLGAFGIDLMGGDSGNADNGGPVGRVIGKYIGGLWLLVAVPVIIQGFWSRQAGNFLRGKNAKALLQKIVMNLVNKEGPLFVIGHGYWANDGF